MMGLWYSIASLPEYFVESHCHCSISVQTLRSPLVIDLSESCIANVIGKNLTSKSNATAPGPGLGNWTNYNFGHPSDYWIIEMDPDY